MFLCKGNGNKDICYGIEADKYKQKLFHGYMEWNGIRFPTRFKRNLQQKKSNQVKLIIVTIFWWFLFQLFEIVYPDATNVYIHDLSKEKGKQCLPESRRKKQKRK